LRALLVPFGLGSIPFVLYINFPLHFCVFLAKFGDLLSHFFFTCLWRILFSISFIVAQLHACVVCIALLAGLAVLPTQGSYFAFALFCLFLENKYTLALRG